MCSKCVPSVCPPICHESDLVRRSKADNLPNWTISHDRDEDFDNGDHDDDDESLMIMTMGGIFMIKQ